MSGGELLLEMTPALLFALSACAVLVGLTSRWLDARGRKRIVTAVWMALTLAFIYRASVVALHAAYYDQRYYCETWIAWFDFFYC